MVNISFSLAEDYKISVRQEEVVPINLSISESERFEGLSTKAKLSWLGYLKKVRAKEKELINIISQSRYLKLLKDTSGLHLRIDEDVQDLELEMKLVKELQSAYADYISEDVNYGMSGDINRILISTGIYIEQHCQE